MRLALAERRKGSVVLIQKVGLRCPCPLTLRLARAEVTEVASDRAPELRKALDSLGFAKEPAAPNQRLHNPIAESMVRNVKGMTTSILLHAGIEPQYWPLAQKYLEWAFNVSTPAVGEWDDDGPAPTRYEVAMGYPIESFMVPFGALVWYKNPDVTTYSPKGEASLFLGAELTDGMLFKGCYRVWPLDAFLEGVCKEVVTRSIAIPVGDWRFPAKTKDKTAPADDFEYEPSILEDNPADEPIFDDIVEEEQDLFGEEEKDSSACRDRFDELLEGEPVRRRKTAEPKPAKDDAPATVGGVDMFAAVVDMFALTTPATGREIRQSDLEQGESQSVDLFWELLADHIQVDSVEEPGLTQRLRGLTEDCLVDVFLVFKFFVGCGLRLLAAPGTLQRSAQRLRPESYRRTGPTVGFEAVELQCIDFARNRFGQYTGQHIQMWRIQACTKEFLELIKPGEEERPSTANTRHDDLLSTCDGSRRDPESRCDLWEGSERPGSSDQRPGSSGGAAAMGTLGMPMAPLGPMVPPLEEAPHVEKQIEVPGCAARAMSPPDYPPPELLEQRKAALRAAKLVEAEVSEAIRAVTKGYAARRVEAAELVASCTQQAVQKEVTLTPEQLQILQVEAEAAGSEATAAEAATAAEEAEDATEWMRLEAARIEADALKALRLQEASARSNADKVE
ncbi:Transposon Ty4-J Gag-Pol polyprotein, partial [Durusdinium trenchii]